MLFLSLSYQWSLEDNVSSSWIFFLLYNWSTLGGGEKSHPLGTGEKDTFQL